MKTPKFIVWKIYGASLLISILECAEQNNATFWTADERLYNGVKDELPWVKWIGDYPLKRRGTGR